MDPRLVRAMCAVMTHRGPDGEGYHDSEHAVLGMRRLAVIDVDGGDQPVYNEDRSVAAVFNGEIYNFAELREGLRRRGHRFATAGDTECLVHLYEEHGDDLVHLLRGMFAFALWDRRRHRLLLARDRLGKKPLFWRADGSGVSFASELKALVQDPAVRREVDPVALDHYLTYQYVPAPWSIYPDVRKLPPAHLLCWQDGRVEVRRYWRLDSSPRPCPPPSLPEAAERLRELLLEATRIRMVSERPVGAFLSGGIDSSAVVAAMARQSADQVKTFSIGFDEERFDERPFARMVARRYGTDHHELVVGTSSLDLLPTLAWHFDEPFADSSAIPSFYVAQLSRRHVVVVLNGDGGDECFGGYRRYLAMDRLRRMPVVRFGAGRLGAALLERSSPRSLLLNAGRALELLAHPAARRYARLMSYFTPEQRSAVYTDDLRERLAGVDSYRLIDDAVAASRAGSPLGAIIDADVETYLPGDLLVKVDITTMANSLEARSPFLDHHLMEWAAGLPLDLKIRSGTTKFLLKRAVEPWLPPELIDRPKMGFGVPLAAWLRGGLRELSWDVLTDRTARSRGLFRAEAVTRLLERHASGHDHSTRLWALIQFELWHRAFIDGHPGAVQPAAAQSAPAMKGPCQGP